MKSNTMKRSYSTSLLSGLFMLSALACGSDKNTSGDGQGDAPAIELKTVTYVPIGDLFPNPERGFYKHTANTEPLSERELRELRKDNITLAFRYFYLKEFRNTPLTTEALQNIENDLSAVRKAGLKAIIRFAYTSSSDEPDAPLNIILEHLEQLKPILQRNKDIIAVMQAGFIGSWGEWYYTTNNLNNPAARKAVLDKILEVLPQDRFLQVRTPKYKQDYVGTQKPLTAADAFSTKASARLGHHNDCFMAGIDDYGTYLDVEADKKYLNAEGLYVPLGGETCPPQGVNPADCAKAQAEMRNLRWTYLNRDYYRGVNDNWVVQGCMEDIMRDMGYRLALQKGEYSQNHVPGGELVGTIKLQNLGYAPPFNARAVELILRPTTGTATYVATLTDDPRKWEPFKLTQLSIKAALPKDLPAGDYKLYLSLPDPEASLHDRPEYSIRLANKDCWEEATGYNDLGVTVKVDPSLNLPQSTATTKFVLKK